MARFCPTCGTQADATTKFCGKCGTRLDEPAANAGTPAPTPPAARVEPPPPPAQTPPVVTSQPGATYSTSPAKSSGGGCGKVLLIGGIVIALLAAIGIGGAAFLAYRAKKKVDEVRDAYKKSDMDKMAEALGGKKAGGGSGRVEEPMPTYPDWSPSSAGAVQPGAAVGGTDVGGNSTEKMIGSVVPMKKGLRITTAISQSNGDYESIKEIRSVTDEFVAMEYSADNIPDRPNPFQDEKQAQSQPARKNSAHSARKILRKDLENAHEYNELFSSMDAPTFPGTTSLGISAEALTELKTKGETAFTYRDVGLKGALGGLLGGLAGMAQQGGAKIEKTEDGKDPLKELQDMAKVSCTLKRTDQKTYAFPVLLNGERVQLPAIRANCVSEDSEDAEFYFLDDVGNPLSLTWKLGEKDRLQVIKLEYAVETPAPGAGGGKGAGGGGGGNGAPSAAAQELEQKLQKQEKVQIYGIYFDFASAEIKPQSKPTLDEIAEVMNAHPDWKLNVAGHTDNVGGDAFNLDLSQKRAAAVKAVLVTQYRIAPERLETSGYGASQPVETNETMEGRARNRRVELSKQ